MYPNTGNNNKPPYNYQGQPYPNPGQPPQYYNPAVPPASYPQQQNCPPQGYPIMTQPQPGYLPNQYPTQMPQQSSPMTGYPPAGQPYPGQQTQGYGYPPGQYAPPPYTQPPPGMGTQQPYPAQSMYPAGNYPTPGMPYQQPQCMGQVPKQNKRPKYVHVGPCTPSLKPLLGCSPATDAQTIYKAAKGFGCDSRAIIQIITHRACSHREEIKKEYSKQYGKSIIERMKSELYEPTKRLVVCLLYTGAQLDAYILFKSTKGIGTDESTLRMILCTRSSAQIAKIREAYSSVSKHSLQEDISGDTSGSFRDILLYMINNPRKESNDVNQAEASNVASQLYSRAIVKMGAPESWIPIFCGTSYAQLQLIMRSFFDQFGITLYAHIKNYFAGNYEKTLSTICSYVSNPLHYYSKYLKEAITCRMLNRIIHVFCTRCEIDLATISQDYFSMYQKTLDSSIRAEFEQENPEVVRGLLMLLGM